MQELENPRRKRLVALLMVLFFAFALPVTLPMILAHLYMDFIALFMFHR